MKYSNTIDTCSFEEITESFFKENYIDLNKPAIIQGILDHREAGKLWSIDNLKSRIGEYPVKVFDKKNRNGTSYLHSKQKIKMAEMLELIETNSESDYRMFVNPILKKDKKLALELACPDFFKCKLQLPNLLFIGGKDCIVPLHFDFMNDDGLLTQFYGRKEVILVDPSQSKSLYKLPFNTTSSVNLFDPDYEMYPALRNIEGTKITLNHGDTLYIPAGYWHQIKYVDASMSVAFRKWNPSLTKNITRATRLSFDISLDKSANFIFGKKWYNYKSKIAQKKANRI